MNISPHKPAYKSSFLRASVHLHSSVQPSGDLFASKDREHANGRKRNADSLRCISTAASEVAQFLPETKTWTIKLASMSMCRT